jgi:uncharacterized membrane protein
MPNCARCGTDNDSSAKFCKNCGSSLDSQGYAPPPPPPPPNQGSYPPPPPPQPGYYQQPPNYGQQTDTGLQPNIAALLCYVLGWLTGLVFFFIDKRPFVRFHAMQSILVFGGFHVLHILLSILFPVLHLWSLLFALSGLISIVSLILWVLLMVKAYQNEWYKVPVVGDIALQKSQQP